ncbi:MAG: hypothetical protein EZS28_004818 [Streblomastix strix]|uniref:Nucleotide-diphospho-sugar transferase domain-containing protein n=1 Tax=Streblomastix strix TaxID=222440 RepID=A0A5J4WZ87_9EUKA|nr:MAG: hypothetical protein EZS28_004818 [Streblomastix strix]
MTLDAINSLQEKSLDAHIGIIIPPGIENFDTIKNRILQSIIQRENIHFVEGQKHFDNWNPTQHKLDMQLFAGQFNPVIWLDSDIFVLKDLLQSAKIFAQSGKWMALLRDHVNNDPAFLSRWEDGAERCFVPQACYMIFRSDIIKEFFNLWESIWREWIYPSPFFSHPDPAPHFPGSAFCIEQYALAQALRRFIGV